MFSVNPIVSDHEEGAREFLGGRQRALARIRGNVTSIPFQLCQADWTLILTKKSHGPGSTENGQCDLGINTPIPIRQSLSPLRHFQSINSEQSERKDSMERISSDMAKGEKTLESDNEQSIKITGDLLGVRGQWEATLEDARAANAHEHSLNVRSALKAYPWAVLWSLIISLSIIMEGYDTALINSLYAYPSYARRFGAVDPATGKYQISARWQSVMSSGSQAGAIVGALANGFIIHRFGFKPAFTLGVLLMASFVFISFFGMSVELQMAGQILCG